MKIIISNIIEIQDEEVSDLVRDMSYESSTDLINIAKYGCIMVITML